MKRTFLSIILPVFLLITSTEVVNAIPFSASTGSQLADGPVVKLRLGDKTYDVQSYALTFARPIVKKKNSGKKTSEIDAEEVYSDNHMNFVIKASKVDQALIDWIVDLDPAAKNGELTVSDGETGKVIRTITLTGIKPSGYVENGSGLNYPGYSDQFTNLGVTYDKINIKLAGR